MIEGSSIKLRHQGRYENGHASIPPSQNGTRVDCRFKGLLSAWYVRSVGLSTDRSWLVSMYHMVVLSSLCLGILIGQIGRSDLTGQDYVFLDP